MCGEVYPLQGRLHCETCWAKLRNFVIHIWALSVVSHGRGTSKLSSIEAAILVAVELLEEMLNVQRVVRCFNLSPCHPLSHGV